MSGFNSHHSENIVSVAGRISRTGAAVEVVAGKDFYISDRGTGLSALTFPRSYVNLISFVATSETPDAVCVVDKADYSQVSVVTVDGSKACTKPSTTDLVAGMAISGAGIPDGAYVESVTSATAFVLSAAATASATVTAEVSTLSIGANSSVLCVRGEAIDETDALADADFSFIACFEVADS
jgi:hypothetical protein